MPGPLDSCINSVYEDGNIPASAGIQPVRVLLKEALVATVSEAATALDVTDIMVIFEATIAEAATAVDVPDVEAPATVPRSAMAEGVFINSDGTPRQANADGVMINL